MTATYRSPMPAPSPKPFRVPSCMCLRGPRTWSLSSRPKRSTNTSSPSFSLASLGGGRNRKSCQPPARPSSCLNSEGGGVKRRCWGRQKKKQLVEWIEETKKEMTSSLRLPEPQRSPRAQRRSAKPKTAKLQKLSKEGGTQAGRRLSKAKESFANDKSTLWLRDARKAASVWEKRLRSWLSLSP